MAVQFRTDDGCSDQPVSRALPLPVTSGNPSYSGDTTIQSVATAVGAVATAGTGYAPNDRSTLSGGTRTVPTVLTVTNTKAISATVVSGGTGGTPGAVTLTGTTGTGTKFQATGTINGSGVLTGALVITVAGDYTVNPTSVAVEPVTNNASATGITVAVVMGVKTVSITTPGQYTVAPSNNVAEASSTGSGTGATYTMTYAAGATILFGGVTPPNGFKVTNPDASEVLWVSDSATAAANGLGSTSIAAAGATFTTQPWERPVGAVTVYGATVGHKVTARYA